MDCRACGACCAHFDNIEVSPYDKTPPHLVAIKPGIWTNDVTGEAQQDMRVMRQDRERRCVALVGVIGQQVSCAVYDCRPTVCRRFNPGGDRCLEARRHFNLAGPARP